MAVASSASCCTPLMLSFSSGISSGAVSFTVRKLRLLVARLQGGAGRGAQLHEEHDAFQGMAVRGGGAGELKRGCMKRRTLHGLLPTCTRQ